MIALVEPLVNGTVDEERMRQLQQCVDENEIVVPELVNRSDVRLEALMDFNATIDYGTNLTEAAQELDALGMSGVIRTYASGTVALSVGSEYPFESKGFRVGPADEFFYAELPRNATLVQVNVTDPTSTIEFLSWTPAVWAAGVFSFDRVFPVMDAQQEKLLSVPNQISIQSHFSDRLVGQNNLTNGDYFGIYRSIQLTF